jgi:hypothetical protein
MPDTWYAVLDADGHLVSTGTVVADDATLASRGYTKQALDSNPTGRVWHPETGMFTDAPVPLKAIPTWEYISRFTAAEYADIEGSADAQVRMIMTMLLTTPTVRVGHPQIQASLGYLVSLGLITPQRAAVIGAV